MEHLPPGWRVSNNAGSFSGPPPIEDNEIDGDSDSENSDNIDIKPDSPGWEDVEPSDDVESLNIKCLICPSTFNSAVSMLDHCNSSHDLDFLSLVKKFKLDFYGTIKLVNYIRGTSGDTSAQSSLTDPRQWADDRFLQPVLEDDALLFCLDDIVDFGDAEQEASALKGQVNGEKMEE